MKKMFAALSVLMLAFTGCAAGAPKEAAESSMSIRPSVFSEETEDVIALLGSTDENIMFFDYTVDDTVKSAEINIWTYQDGEWVSGGSASGWTNALEDRIGLRFREDGYDIFANGTCRYDAEKGYGGFADTQGWGAYQLSDTTEIKVNEEIPLWVKIGDDGNGVTVSRDFRRLDCTAGMAATITFSDKELN